MVPGTIKLLHPKIKIKSNGDREGCRLDLNPSPDESDNGAGKGISGMEKFGRMRNMKQVS